MSFEKVFEQKVVDSIQNGSQISGLRTNGRLGKLSNAFLAVNILKLSKMRIVIFNLEKIFKNFKYTKIYQI